MRTKIVPAIIIFLTLAALIAGCSGDPVNPGGLTDEGSSIPSAGRSQDGNIRSNLGYYEIDVDTETGEAEIFPVRNADMHLNVTGIINKQMGVSIAGVPGESDPPNGLIVLDITLTHPIPNDQFTGFDVMGILMAPGSLAVEDWVFADADETRLTNADGCTRWWNPTEFTAPGFFGYTQGNLAKTPVAALTATVNPYKYFANALWPESVMTLVYAEPLDADNGRGVFSAGSDNTRRYRIQFEMNPGPQIKFGYAIGASWAPPNIKPPGAVPDDFPINANQPEPFYIGSAIKANSLYYDSESGQGGGVFRLQVNVHDWQGMQAGNVMGDVETVMVYSPDLYSGGVQAYFKEQNAIRATYLASLESELNPTEAGEALIIMRAESKDGPSYDQGFGPAPTDNISAFQTLLVNVVDPDCSADANNEFVDYIDFDLTTPTTGQLCAPADYKDYYRFELEPGFRMYGSLILHCNAEPTRIELYDINEVKIAEASVSGGTATIDLFGLNPMPGQYYIRVVTQTTDQAFLYLLEYDGTLYDLTPNPVSITPPLLYFNVSNVISDDNYVYFSGPEAFWIFDLPMALDSMYISRTLMGSSGRPCVSYPWACCMGDWGFYPGTLSLLDMTNPASPTVYDDVYTSPSRVHAVAMDSEYVYTVINDGAIEKLVVLDYLSDPSNPPIISDGDYTFTHTVDSLDIVDPDGAEKYLIAREGAFAFILAIDISDPAAPVLHDMVGYMGGEIRDLTVQDNFVYYIYSNSTDDEYLKACEVTPSDITGHGSTLLTWDGHYIDARGDYAYVTDDNSIMTVVDITDPDTLVESNAASGYSRLGKINVNGENVFIIDPLSRMGLYGAAEDSDMFWFYGNITGINNPVDSAIDGAYMYIVQFENLNNESIITVDISDKENVRVVGYLPLAEQSNELVNTDYGLIAGVLWDSFWTIDASDPVNLSLGVKTMLPSEWAGLASDGTHLYLSDNADNLNVYTFPAWPNANLANTVAIPEEIYSLIVKGDVLYGSKGVKLYTFSLADPLTPVLADTYTTTATITDIKFQGQYMYLTKTDAFEILDVSNPLDPVPVGTVDHSSTGYALCSAVAGQFAWVGFNGDNVNLYRIYPPESPVCLGNFYISEGYAYTGEIMIFGDYYMSFSYPYGIEIMDMYP